MNQKTPKFNVVLEKYFSELQLDEKGGQERTCRFSGVKFYIPKEDIDFYKKIQVPLPTLCPHERTRGKLAVLNVFNLFFIDSTKTKKRIISAYPSNTPYKIYEHTIWNDSDFAELGNEYDLNKNFFEQYRDFQLKIPRPNLIQKNATNSDYTHTVNQVKNCYLVFDTENSEDSQCSSYINNSKNCYHTYGTINSDISYENTLCDKLYKTFFSEFSENCMDSTFLFDCKNCSECFMCTNLRHKKYCFENKQLSKEEYQEKVKNVNLGSYQEIKKYKQQFNELKKQAIHRAHHNEKNVNCTGDYNVSSKNCESCFYVLNSEELKYVAGARDSCDCMDVAVCMDSELVFESMIWDVNCYNVKFSGKVDNLRDSEYCDLCKNCSNCFACIGLKNKKFHIFNKLYSEEKYWKKIDEIKTKMLEGGEYGEFFPPELLTFPYQITTAVSFQGYDDIEIAKQHGYNMEEIPETIQQTDNEISYAEVPYDIKEITDEILNKVIIDKNDKKFRYTKEELEFHRKYNLALPREHYSTILARKRISLGPVDFNIKYRNCTKCNQKTQVTFPEDHPDAPFKVYCEKCYNEAVS